MKKVYCCFPGGKHKALTMSYDDGRTQDRRLVALFNRFGLTGCIVCAVLWGLLAVGFAELPSAQRYALMTGIPFAVHMLSGAAMAALLTLLVRIFYQRPMYFIRNA